jgi:hypothetical protein
VNDERVAGTSESLLRVPKNRSMTPLVCGLLTRVRTWRSSGSSSVNDSANTLLRVWQGPSMGERGATCQTRGPRHDLITQHYGILKSEIVIVVDLAAASVRWPAWRLW